MDRIQETQLTNERRSAGEIRTEAQKNGNGKQGKVSVSDIEMSTVGDKPTRSMSARVAWEETHSSISMDDSSSHKLAHNIRTMINIRKFIANLKSPSIRGSSMSPQKQRIESPKENVGEEKMVDLNV